jgi:hypothetical protein
MEEILFKVVKTEKGLVSQVTCSSIGDMMALSDIIDDTRTRIVKAVAEKIDDKSLLDIVQTVEKLSTMSQEQREQIAKDLQGLVKGK